MSDKPEPRCTLCGATIKSRFSQFAECSHIECPNRKAPCAQVPDNNEYVWDGAYRVTPTSKE